MAKPTYCRQDEELMRAVLSAVVHYELGQT